MTLRFRIFLLFFSFLFLQACKTSYQAKSMQYFDYRITNKADKDSTLQSLLQPYSDSVNATMNGVIGYAEKSLDKDQPECRLGNFLADLFLQMAEKSYNTKVDVAVMNYGGMRLTQVPAGEITTGKIYELMPFDNLLILQKVKGNILKQFLDLTAEKGGWPVSGLTMQIRDKKAINIMIGGVPLEDDKYYTVVNSDFLANGGDNAFMLKDIPQITNGYLMRDAIMDYIKSENQKGHAISAELQNRVSYAQ
ncbi:MAG TPA: 5'-nucleotidase [Chitinophagaceae bacterium]|nr:5'-nucleotidase [Chitinophagaceae bacterium]